MRVLLILLWLLIIPGSGSADFSAPYPYSTVITNITWAPRSEIIRLAKGSDNWPTAWAEDDSLFTAYGDGNGFEPFLPRKVSLGIAQIFGDPPAIKGVNIPTSGEFLGEGPNGSKASGLVMLDGTLYMFVRHVVPPHIMRSRDRGKTWENGRLGLPAFGCPTFLAFGPNGTRSRDDFVYIYSPDVPSSYEVADRMVLARVSKYAITDRSSYRFFKGLNPDATPVWSIMIEERGAVFSFPGHCYRSGVSYNPGLKRYLWCQILPQSKHPQGPRFQGGFGIYDAPEPWGPWTTVFFTTDWDIGPGETNSFPPKWMSADGKTLYLLFSGDDSFSLRKAELNIGSE